jgi:hypothetical protein
MSRELAIRVPPEIGGWVRQQPAASETVLVLAKDAWKRGQQTTCLPMAISLSRTRWTPSHL